MTRLSAARRDGSAAPNAAVHRIRRTFWLLCAGTVIAAGVLSDALTRPAGAGTAALVAVSGVTAVIGVSLAGRILVVTSRLGPSRTRRRFRRRRDYTSDWR